MYALDSSGDQESKDRPFPKYKHLNRIPDLETPVDGQCHDKSEGVGNVSSSTQDFNLQRFKYTPKTQDTDPEGSWHLQSPARGFLVEDLSVSSIASVWADEEGEGYNRGLGPENRRNSSAWSSARLSPSSVPGTSNLFQHPQEYESDPFSFQDDSFSDQGANSKAMFSGATSTIFDANESDGRNIKKNGKSVTFNNEDIFNIYDENINSTFDLVGPPSQSQLIQGSQARLGSSSQLSPTARKISSSQCIKKTADGIFKLPETPCNNTRSRTGSGSLDPVRSRSHSHLDAELTSKLLSFSDKLKSLTDPGTPLTSEKITPRLGSGLVTPRNKTPEIGARHGSVSSRGATNLPDPSCFAAVYEGTGSAAGEVGVAAMYLDNPRLVICQFSDTKTYPSTITKLLGLNPSVILLPETFGKCVKLYDDIATKFAGAAVQKVHRKHYNESKGLQLLRHLICPDFSSVEMQFHNKYYCLAAANSLLKV